jgi:tetratricopeptide (TPR) repeat protein
MVIALLPVLGLTAALAEFEHCAATLGDDTRGRSTAMCVRAAADASHQWERAVAWLEVAWHEHPGAGWLALQIAELKSQRRAPDALEWYTAAIASLAASGDHQGEAQARIGLGVALSSAGRHEEAWSEAPKILQAAERSADPTLVARACVYEGWLAHRTGRQLSQALHSLRRAESLVFPTGPYAQQVRVLVGLGNISFELGRYDVALSHFNRAIDLARHHDDKAMMALGASNVLTTRRKQMEVRPDPSRLPEFTEEARRLADVADGVANSELQAIAQRALGDLLASAAVSRDEAGAHYERALGHARRSRNLSEMATCLWALGRYRSDSDPRGSRALVDEALKMAADAGSASAMAYAWRQQMRLAWKTLPRERAVAESLRALDAIDTLRMLQDADLERASVLGAWTNDYYWLIGHVLDTVPRSRESLATAFAVSERMRARVLLDALQRQRAGERPTAVAGHRREVLTAISAIQRRLLDPALHGQDRDTALAELERLEREEAMLRAGGNAQSTVAPSALADLDGIQRSLAPNEALLSFTVGVGSNFYGEFGGGAWLLAVTRAGTQVIALPDRTRLEPALSVFRGLVERPGSIDEGPGITLFEQLLSAALRSFPASVTRLIVIADGALHHLPFAQLKPSAGVPPLGTTHEIIVAPSATIWRQLQQRPAPVGASGALVLADPVLPDSERQRSVAHEREWSGLGLDAGSLPHARAEGRAVIRRVGGGSRLLTGAEATESALSSTLAAFTIIHFATHAFIDETHPERSAVLLSGAGGDDGLLQAREIADLPLAGRVVVLSACRTASGTALAGEGIIGLSRPFFEAGARAVVGTLWAIRDDYAAQFADALYASLGQGQSVAAAVRDAQRQAIAAGLPAVAWAGYVVIGDGSVVPVHASERASTRWRFVVLATIVAALLLGFLLWHRAARRQRGAAL